MTLILRSIAMIAIVVGLDAARAQSPDIIVADFEGDDYGRWVVEGTAFGQGPARGTLPGQMAVEGFEGRGLVNSFAGGDGSTGLLTSPPFAINRRWIRFLIGGGGWAGETCTNLLVDGQIVRTAAGPNKNPGGSERLEPAAWDVGDLAGKTARLQIVDRATGGWGHTNVDQIVLTDRKPPGMLRDVARELTIDHRYLHLPVKTGAPKRRMAVLLDGQTVREFEIELADDPGWWAHLDVGAWRGRKIVLRVDRLAEDSTALHRVAQADDIWAAGDVYREPLRARYHFSPRRGWNNDPNGLVYSGGEYHLYFQHNPYGWNWGNMHWGHAVSPDLVHWRELPIAIYPRRFGDWAFSGSAVVDRSNTSGWKQGADDLLVAAYTSTGRGECIVYSNDRGRTWTEFAGSPVVAHQGRDPRLLWHEPTRRWVMAVYDESEGKQWIAFHTSPDLKAWNFRGRIEGFFECPDLFELPVDGDSARRKWVLTAASSEYVVGTFDGATFRPETPKRPGHRGRGFYAAQTFSHDPRGRVVQIGWFQTATPGMPFNQGMSLPLALSLRTTPDGPRLAWQPVEELKALRSRAILRSSGEMKPGDITRSGASGELLEIRAEFAPDPKSTLAMKVRGVEIVHDAARREIRLGGLVAPAPLAGGKQRLIVFADRTGLEVFAGDGLTYIPLPINLDLHDSSPEIRVAGGPIRFDSLEIYELKSIWPADEGRSSTGVPD
jgi:fructan beta-fructosidase